jgi:transcriptional regulator with XRE-family HTH domain
MIQGHRLREAREQRALSQGALGKLVAKDGAYISKIERGVLVSVSTTTLERLVAALEVSADYLLGLPEPPIPTTRQRRKPSSRGQKAVHQEAPAPAPAARRTGHATNGTQLTTTDSPEPAAPPAMCPHCAMPMQPLGDGSRVGCPGCRYSVAGAT